MTARRRSLPSSGRRRCHAAAYTARPNTCTSHRSWRSRGQHGFSLPSGIRTHHSAANHPRGDAMPSRAARPCTNPGCRNAATTGGKCSPCKTKQRKHADQQRGTASARGYGRDHEQHFRLPILQRDGYTCVDCGGFGDRADHDPVERRDLVALGMDPNSPDHGVTRCEGCHNSKTAKSAGRGNLPHPTDR